MAKTPQQLKFAKVSAQVRNEGIKPFTKAFGKRFKQLMKKGGASIKKRSKKTGSKKKSGTKGSSSNRSKTSRSSTMAKNKGGSRKGTSMKTRLVKFGAGAGIAVVISIIANALRRNEINAAAPIIDAAAGIGIEGQVGTAIVRTVAPLLRGGFNLNGGSRNGNMALEGA